MQLLVLLLFIFALALIGVFYPYNRGAPYTACIVLYALTAGISGYLSARLFRQMGGESWVCSPAFFFQF
jgi:transmembrane 9 superfamily member 1